MAGVGRRLRFLHCGRRQRSQHRAGPLYGIRRLGGLHRHTRCSFVPSFLFSLSVSLSLSLPLSLSGTLLSFFSQMLCRTPSHPHPTHCTRSHRKFPLLKIRVVVPGRQSGQGGLLNDLDASNRAAPLSNPQPLTHALTHSRTHQVTNSLSILLLLCLLRRRMANSLGWV